MRATAGKIPGAIGPGGTREKNVTIAIARKLRSLLNDDPMFKGVLTRDGDYFISVMGRSDVARKQNANFLVSIHADAAPNRSATGASVWVLSNRRANSEMANWLEEHEKQSELLGGAGDVLANSQFRSVPQPGGAGFTVRSFAARRPRRSALAGYPVHPCGDGLYQYNGEERLLGSDSYQQQIAEAIYKGLRNYFEAHPLQFYRRSSRTKSPPVRWWNALRRWLKELVENSLDAGATRIDIDIERGGAKLIRIRDNGCGIKKEELALALARHAPVKSPLWTIWKRLLASVFRGEALASISSVSRLTLTSRTAAQQEAWQAYAEGRDMDVTVKPAAHPVGTTLEVLDLFYNTPARRKFMRTEKTEFGHIDEIIRRIALARFDVTINLSHNGKVMRQYRAVAEGGQKERRLGGDLRYAVPGTGSGH
ncbi:hypothetical protein L1887_42899 [Cichorium endivia]|nr:hypothetical protein L1887_42899 [Cichorium endivia]